MNPRSASRRITVFETCPAFGSRGRYKPIQPLGTRHIRAITSWWSGCLLPFLPRFPEATRPTGIGPSTPLRSAVAHRTHEIVASATLVRLPRLRDRSVFSSARERSSLVFDECGSRAWLGCYASLLEHPCSSSMPAVAAARPPVTTLAQLRLCCQDTGVTGATPLDHRDAHKPTRLCAVCSTPLSGR